MNIKTLMGISSYFLSTLPRIITFPKHPTVIIIEVEQYNSDEEFQLFYAPDGKLLQSLDVTELGGEIYPGLFFND